MKPLVFVDGDLGTTGLQILSRLAGRDDLNVLTLSGESRKNLRLRTEAINSCNVAILCLPDEAARQAAAAVTNPAVRLIDASSAHRTDPSWVYGLPEMDHDQPGKIAAARRVSNPGCYPTGAIALLRPLITAGLLPASYPVTINATSGYSGRGREGVEEHEGSGSDSDSGRALPFQVYGLGLQHKHVAEIQQYSRLLHRPLFVPSYGAYRQGIVLTIPIHLHLLPTVVRTDTLRACLESHYANSDLVKVVGEFKAAEMQRLDPQIMNGGNEVSLAVFGNAEHQQVLLTAVFDNLGKGASGAAVQNLDLMLRRHPSGRDTLMRATAKFHSG